LKKRLGETGGLEAFKLALSAIPQDNWLMGKVLPKDGRKAFRLSLHYLVARDDALAKLADCARDGRPAANGSAAASDPNGLLRILKENPSAAELVKDDTLRNALKDAPEAERMQVLKHLKPERVAALDYRP
jgi:hypothetical protein